MEGEDEKGKEEGKEDGKKTEEEAGDEYQDDFEEAGEEEKGGEGGEGGSKAANGAEEVSKVVEKAEEGSKGAGGAEKGKKEGSVEVEKSGDGEKGGNAVARELESGAGGPGKRREDPRVAQRRERRQLWMDGITSKLADIETAKEYRMRKREEIRRENERKGRIGASKRDLLHSQERQIMIDAFNSRLEEIEKKNEGRRKRRELALRDKGRDTRRYRGDPLKSEEREKRIAEISSTLAVMEHVKEDRRRKVLQRRSRQDMSVESVH